MRNLIALLATLICFGAFGLDTDEIRFNADLSGSQIYQFTSGAVTVIRFKDGENASPKDLSDLVSGAIDHGSATGLSDNDHPQYLYRLTTTTLQVSTAPYEFLGARFLITSPTTLTITANPVIETLDFRIDDQSGTTIARFWRTGANNFIQFEEQLYFTSNTIYVGKSSGSNDLVFKDPVLGAEKTLTELANASGLWEAFDSSTYYRLIPVPTVRFSSTGISEFPRHLIIDWDGSGSPDNAIHFGPTANGVRLTGNPTTRYISILQGAFALRTQVDDAEAYGLFGRIAQTNTTTNTNTVYGVYGISRTDDGSTVTAAVGVAGTVQASDASDLITNAYSLYAIAPTTANATAVITNAYGVYAENPTVGTTLNWSGWFAGDVNIVGDLTVPSVTITDSIHINGDFTGLGAGDLESVFSLTADIAGSAAGEIHALDVLEVGSGSGDVVAVGTHTGIGVIHQHIGTFIVPGKAWKVASAAWTDTTIAFGSGATDTEIFTSDNDVIYIGQPATFDEIEVILNTNASHTIIPIFEYWSGAAWSSFVPTDGACGFTHDGIIAFASALLTGWATTQVNGEGDGPWFYIRITRTRNTLPTPPIEDTIKTLDATEYEWDELGNIAALSFSGTTAMISESASGQTANVNADNLVIESGSNHAGMSILSPTGSAGIIYFGDSGEARQGLLQYVHSTDIMTLSSSNALTVFGSTWAIETDGDMTGFKDATMSGVITGGSFITGQFIGPTGDSNLLELSANELIINGSVGINTAGSPDVTGLQVVGILKLSETETNGANKNNLIIAEQYDVAGEPEGYTGVYMFAGSDANVIAHGGAHGNHNAATEISFWTAANHTTRTGTRRMTITTTGAVVVADELTVAGEMLGSRVSVIATLNDMAAAIVGVNSEYLKVGEVLMTATKGFTMIRAGSIVGVSANYDNLNVLIAPDLDLEILKNGAIVWTVQLGSADGADQETQDTQARGTDTFAAGDTISIRLTNNAGATDEIETDKTIVVLEIVHDS